MSLCNLNFQFSISDVVAIYLAFDSGYGPPLSYEGAK